MKNRSAYFLVLAICTTLYAVKSDSLYFSYDDFSTYKILTTGLNFSNIDSLSVFRLTGNNRRTVYEKYSKNDFDLEGMFASYSGRKKFGCVLSTNHISNTFSIIPTSNNIKIMPLAGYRGNRFNIEGAFGYISKLDKNVRKEGQAVSLSGNINKETSGSALIFQTANSADNSDRDINYSSSSNLNYVKILDDNVGNISFFGNSNLQQYSFSDGAARLFKIKRYEFTIGSVFLYNASENLNNTLRISYYARNRDSYKNRSLFSYNSNTNISISDEVVFTNNSLRTSARLDFDAGGDKFSLDNYQADKSLAFYNFSLSSHIEYFIRNLRTGLRGRFYKHEHKSLSLNNFEDRDIIRINLIPETDIFMNKLSIEQSFPLEYYRLVNISASRSANNFTDRSVNSITRFNSYLTEKLDLNGKLHFRSYFRSYDYDANNSRSFVIKNYSLSDTVSYRLSDKIRLSLSKKFEYEEFGYLNFKKFVSNPISFKNHYYSSFSVRAGRFGNILYTAEYFFYEIDSYNFDQSDFSKHHLKEVYISHGPKLSASYASNNTYIASTIEIDNFRKNDRQVRFRIQGSYSFN